MIVVKRARCCSELQNDKAEASALGDDVCRAVSALACLDIPVERDHLLPDDGTNTGVRPVHSTPCEGSDNDIPSIRSTTPNKDDDCQLVSCLEDRPIQRRTSMKHLDDHSCLSACILNVIRRWTRSARGIIRRIGPQCRYQMCGANKRGRPLELTTSAPAVALWSSDAGSP